MAEPILKYLVENNEANTLELTKIFQEDHQKIIGAVKSIQANNSLLITVEPVNVTNLELTEEGDQVAQQGSHEANIYHQVPPNGIAQSKLMELPNGKVGFSKAMSNGWLFVDKSLNPPLIKKKIEKIDDLVHKHLNSIKSNNCKELNDKQLNEYKKRKLVHEITIKSFIIKKGPEFSLTLNKLETDLTSDMLANDKWKNLTFKKYNFDALGVSPNAGCLHPLLRVRSEFRQIFLEMGFSEMPTNSYIESSFWNFDALFQPQQHPARDAHDTFFISDPKCSYEFPEKYLKSIKSIHSKGGYGSKGYGYEWKIEEAQKNLLRTHTTAVSAKMLYKWAQEKEFKQVKWFSIDKVFRNETLDATHLAEFHQVEGVIADYDLTLGDLIGVFTEFFKKLGLLELEFKPAYNPYTEPSMEIFCYHPGLKKWIELGNSGMFRPEMLLPMGLPENVKVIAWGLSLERPTMIKYNINNIRDLAGSKIDLEMISNSPICRFNC